MHRLTNNGSSGPKKAEILPGSKDRNRHQLADGKKRNEGQSGNVGVEVQRKERPKGRCRKRFTVSALRRLCCSTELGSQAPTAAAAYVSLGNGGPRGE